MTFRFILLFICLVALQVNAQQRQALEMLVKAENKLADGDTTQAMAKFQDILKTYPQSYAAISRLAELTYAKKDYSRSMQYIFLAIDIIEIRLDENESQRLQPGTAQRRAMLEDMHERYTKDLASLYHLLGRNKVKLGQLTAATEAYQKAISLNNQSAFYIDLGLVYLNNDQFTEGVKTLHQVIAMDSTNYKPYYNLANAYHAARQYDSATYYYEKTTLLYPSLPYPYLYLAQIYTTQGQPYPAILNLTQYIKLDSNKVEPYFRRALLYTNQAEFNSALRDWNKVLELEPKNNEALRNRGLTHFYLEDFEQAIVDFTTALALNEEPYTLINRGYSYYLNDQPTQALEDLDKGLAILSKYSLGYYIRALTLADLKKKKKACEDLRKALDLGFNENEVDKKLMRKCF